MCKFYKVCFCKETHLNSFKQKAERFREVLILPDDEMLASQSNFPELCTSEKGLVSLGTQKLMYSVNTISTQTSFVLETSELKKRKTRSWRKLYSSDVLVDLMYKFCYFIVHLFLYQYFSISPILWHHQSPLTIIYYIHVSLDIAKYCKILIMIFLFLKSTIYY